MKKILRDEIRRQRAARVLSVDYTRKVSVPVRDFERDGEVTFVVDVYGVEPRDLAIVPGGGAPMMRAVDRMGLDPIRFQATIWDIPS